MVVDISELISKKVTKKEFNLFFESKELFDGNEAVEFSKPIDFSIVLTMIGDIINLNGILHTELKLTCSRCLEKFTYPIDIEINEKLSSNKGNKDDEIIFIDSDKLDITEIIENNILIALPIKRLCKEECKGLCQHCGANLNYSTCKCKNEDVDLRLAKLKDLFSTD